MNKFFLIPCLALLLGSAPGAYAQTTMVNSTVPASEAESRTFAASDLLRLRVGNDVGILTVFQGPRASGERLFTKATPRLKDTPGLDAAENFPESAEDRQAIFTALGITDPASAARQIMDHYTEKTYPKRNAVALLGTLGNSEKVDEPLKAKIREFLCAVAEVPVHAKYSETANILRRQALLALTLQAETDPTTEIAVAQLLSRTTNEYIVSAVAKFFHEHSQQIRQSPELAQVRAVVVEGRDQSAKDSVLQTLDSPPSPQ